MSTGKPDYNRAVTITGKSGSNYVPVLVDANGQLYITLTGQSIAVNNLPADYLKENGNANINNLPSDYFRAGESVGSIAANVVVDQSDSDRTIQGKDGETLRYVALDSSGIMLARLKGAFGGVLKDIAVDTNGIIYAALKGTDGAELRDILVDESGKIIANMQGALLDETVLLSVITIPDQDAADEWATGNDMDAITLSAAHRHDGPYGLKATIDATKTGADSGYLRSTTDRGDLSAYTTDYLYLRVWLETTAHMLDDSNAVSVLIGTDSSNLINFDYALDALQNGWNLLKCPLAAPTGTAGTITWSDIEFLQLTVRTVVGNTVDFDVATDSWEIVRQTGVQGAATSMAVDARGRLTSVMHGVYSGQLTPIALDSDGVMRANLVSQSLPVLVTRPAYGAMNNSGNGESVAATGSVTLLNYTDGDPGKIAGGSIRLTASASMKDSYATMTIDGVEVGALPFEILDKFGLTQPHSMPLYLTKFDDTNFNYAVAISPDITFQSSFLITVYKATATVHSLEWDINYYKAL